ncbi:MAG: DUF4129 domain-containing protein [Acidimicrobiia bacterium]
MSELPVPDDNSADEARRLADEILQRPEFQRAKPGLLERSRDWLARQLSKLFQFASDSGLGTVLSVLFLAGAVTVIAVLIIRVWKVRVVRPERADMIDADVTVRSGIDAAGWRAMAQDHASAGRWREAIRCRYRALVAEMAERRLVDDNDASTTGAERQQVAERAPSAASSFEDVTNIFDEVWYGGGQADADTDSKVADESTKALGAGR